MTDLEVRPMTVEPNAGRSGTMGHLANKVDTVTGRAVLCLECAGAQVCASSCVERTVAGECERSFAENGFQPLRNATLLDESGLWGLTLPDFSTPDSAAPPHALSTCRVT